MGKRSRKRDREPSAVERRRGESASPHAKRGATAVAAPPEASDSPSPGRRRSRDQGEPRSPQRRPRREDRPKAPWDPFPLVELCVFFGLIFLILGLIFIKGPGGQALLGIGIVLAALGGLDTAIREHFTGYKSHSTILAGLPTVVAAGIGFFSKAPTLVVFLVAVACFAVTFSIFRAAFQRRAGVAWR